MAVASLTRGRRTGAVAALAPAAYRSPVRGAGPRIALAGACALAACPGARDRSADACPAAAPTLAADASSHSVKTLFVIVMENQDWSSVVGSPSAPYVNGTLLPRFAHAEAFRNGGLHPSLPNYVVLEAGDALGVASDASPPDVPLPVSCHLVTWLEATGLSWKAYQEGIDGATCPIADVGRYAVRHDPFVYFEDVSGSPPSPSGRRCIDHVRPYAELSGDLQSGAVARYNFITPDLCDDGHDRCAPWNDPVRQADAWLERELPPILASRAWQDGGAVLITWDEPSSGDRPIGMIVVSPLAKPGYAGSLPYSHASTLRTVQEVLGVEPLLRGAATATSLSDLFTAYP